MTSDASPGAVLRTARIPRPTTGHDELDELDAIMVEARRAAHDVVLTARHLSSDHVREVRTEGHRSVGGAQSKAEALIANAYGHAEAVRLAAIGDRASAQESLRSAARHLERSLRQAADLRQQVDDDTAASRARVAVPTLRGVEEVVTALDGVAGSTRQVVDEAAAQCDEALRRLADLRRRLAPASPPVSTAGQAAAPTAGPTAGARLVRALNRALRPADDDGSHAP